MMNQRKSTNKGFSIYQSYQVHDIARIVGKNAKTIRLWIGKGLTPIDPHSKTLLFSGKCIQQFLAQTKKRKKVTLKEHEFWCMKCRAKTTAKPKSIVRIKNRKHAVCLKCSTKINKYIGKLANKPRAP